MPTSLKFNSFEAAADLFVLNMVRGKPLRSLITLIHVAGGIKWLASPSDERYAHRSLAARKAGYLVPLFKETDRRFVGLNAYDALSVWGEDEAHAHAANNLFSYADFCEIAPNVHKGFLNEITTKNSCKLSWKSNSYASYESKDSIISNLFNPFAVHDPFWKSEWFFEKALAPDRIVLSEMLEKLQGLTDLFGARFLEISTLSEEAMRAAAGVSTTAFKGFRAACLALAEFHTLLLEAMWTYCSNDDQLAHDFEFKSELLDQLTPCWKISFVHGLLAELANISVTEVESLMDVYAFAAGADRSRAEGFCPPFVATDDTYIFLPLSAQYAMSSRNIAYSCLQKHPERFDNEVSSFLEPRLIEVAATIFNCLNEVRVERNVRWRDGEIDLVVYCELEKTILLVEAKAAVAPEGGRMTRNTESRVHYGLAQLAKFKALESEEKEKIFSAVFGHGLEGIKYVDVILTWAGFGTEAVWSKFGDATPVNIALLAHLVASYPDLKLAEFPILCTQLIDEIVAAANPIWETVEGHIGDLSFSYPLLSFDSNELVKYQVAPHKLLRKKQIVL